LFKGPLPAGLMSKSRASLLVLLGIGATVLVWQSNLGQAQPEPTTASTSNTKKDQSATLASEKLNTVAAQAKPAPPDPQAPHRIAPSDSAATASSSEMARQIQIIAREMETVEQGLDQLKAEQSRMARENVELNEQLKAMHEVARHNIELTEGLKAMQEQTAREISGLGERLKASQDLMTTVVGQLKDNQEQAARLAAEQKQRNVRKPAPKLAASPAGLQPQAPRNLQPRQQ
jgi:chromosome segregation ATPase